MREILISGLTELGLSPDEAALERFERYEALLSERNAVMNLTAIQGAENIARGHFLDCCALLGLADFESASVIDVGTGAGFPGLPLKIMRPNMRLCLLDSQQKRVDFLREVIEAAGLDNVTTLCCRAEEAPKELREGFDIAVSRAVARLNVLSELCLPFVRPGGLFIAMKGPAADEETREASGAIEQLGGKIVEIRPYAVPGTELEHRAVIIKKQSPTPSKYPRRWAKIIKNPLSGTSPAAKSS